MAPEDMDIPKFGEIPDTTFATRGSTAATAFEDADVAAKVKELMDLAAVEAWTPEPEPEPRLFIDDDPEDSPHRAVITIDISLELTDLNLLHLDQGDIKEILKAAGLLSSWVAYFNG